MRDDSGATSSTTTLKEGRHGETGPIAVLCPEVPGNLLKITAVVILGLLPGTAAAAPPVPDKPSAIVRTGRVRSADTRVGDQSPEGPIHFVGPERRRG